MRPRIERALGLLVLCGGSIACGPPSPSEISLHTVESGVTESAEPPTTVSEGDLFVVDANPRDDDESMELCIDATVTGPTASAVRVSRVRGNCRRFVVVAQGNGTATITFEARGTKSVLVLNVLPAR